MSLPLLFPEVAELRPLRRRARVLPAAVFIVAAIVVAALLGIL